jgi:kynurenine formamidase
MPTLIDLSQILSDQMPVYPGDKSPRLTRTRTFARDGYNDHRLTTGMHAGTHIDGPMHLTDKDRYLDEIPAERFSGNGCLLHAAGESVIRRKPEYESLVERSGIVLVHTGWSRLFGQEKYYVDYPVLSLELARLFVEKHIRMVCLDSPSPDREPYEVHKLLFANDILVAENLTGMDQLLHAKRFEVFAFPLRLHADSAPARIMARILE